MARADPEADVVATPDFWQTSRQLKQSTQHPALSFFSSSRLDLPGKQADAGESAADTLVERSPGLITLGSVALEQDGFFRLPPLGPVEQEQDIPQAEQQASSAASSTASSASSCSEYTRDVWTGTAEPSGAKIGCRTWDAFKNGQIAQHQPLFISEAGPAAYDALLRQITDPPELSNSDAVVVEAKTYMSCLLALALGRDSTFFRKDERLNTFHPALASFRISGYSQQVLDGVQSETLRCASSFLELGAFARLAYAKESSRCEVALASCISHVLQAVEQRLAVDGIKPRSLLQLQASIRDVSAALTPLAGLVSRLQRDSSDEETLSLIFDMASSLDHGQGFVRVVVREILQRVSAPWIELMEEWIGTKQERGIPLSKSRVGEGKGFVKVEADAYVDDFGRELQHVDFRLCLTKVPDFMPSDVIAAMFETGRNVRFIRTFHPDHPLAQQDVIESAQPPRARWLYDWDQILDVEGRLTRYRDSLREALGASRRGSHPITCDREAAASAPSSASRLQFFGLDQQGMEERMLASIKELDQPSTRPMDVDPGDAFLRNRLFDMKEADVDEASDMPPWSLLPLLSFGALASAQAQIINRESLRLLFDAHDVRGQLRLQRDFHLFANGMFCSRLSHALFDPDLTCAERQAGVARQGVMGLRLGGRDAWPPASSELRLVLIGVLTDSHASHAGSRSGTRTGDSPLSGSLSFAVRDLSTEEIDKCMDPDSLEALDFLRLSYKTPPQLGGIISPVHLMHYDRIFKLLLRVLRMQYVTKQQCMSVKAQGHGWQWPSNASLRFNREAHHLVSSVVSYFVDVGVAIPWQKLEHKMDRVRASVDDDGVQVSGQKLASPDELREAHSRALDAIMYALFLRKRQRPVLQLLEELFSIVLRHAKRTRLEATGRWAEAQDEAPADKLYGEFRKKMQVFMTICRGLSEKSDNAYEEPGAGEDSLVAQLLLKLDMGDFYVG